MNAELSQRLSAAVILLLMLIGNVNLDVRYVFGLQRVLARRRAPAKLNM